MVLVSRPKHAASPQYVKSLINEHNYIATHMFLQVEDSHDTTNLSDPDICSKGTTLSDKDICRNEMMPLHNCLSGDGSEIIVPFTSNLQRSKQDLRALVGGLPLLQPSPACEARVKPFLCLHVFGLCDSSGKYHTSLRRECTEIRDNICAKEWRKAVDLLGDDALPVCEDLPDVTEECVMEGTPWGQGL